MRIWSIHPKYLDAKGLVALWRETLLAKAVLIDSTKGYSNHSQLVRFKQQASPVNAINYYLSVVHDEAIRRGYKFDKTKVGEFNIDQLISVTNGQVEFESSHLFNKLMKRDQKWLDTISFNNVQLHPLFVTVNGPIESWEKI